jgi:hypothetical protein
MENTNMVIVYGQEVEINNISRVVGFKIDYEEEVMQGVVGSSYFTWKYTKYEVPDVVAKVKKDTRKAAVYGRLYILKRLEMDGITLEIKTHERQIEYMHIDTLDNVWINVFENGYLRGEVDGIPFVWCPMKYKEAIVLDIAGFNGHIRTKIDTGRIRSRLVAAGYKTPNQLFIAVKEYIKNNGKVNVALNDPFKNISEDVSKDKKEDALA